MIGIDVEGKKDALGFWLSEYESSRHWLQILEEITQRCIVHLMRNATRSILRKRWSEFAKDIKEVYKAVSLDEAVQRKVADRKGAFPSEISLYKLLYLRIEVIKESWNRPVHNWPKVLNQLVILYDDRITRHMKF